MKIDNQVCTLEQADKLKQLGIAQEGYLCYTGDGVKTDIELTTDFEAREMAAYIYRDRTSAFTVAELCIMALCDAAEKSGYNTKWSKGEFLILYQGSTINRFTNQAQALAYLLILLIEKGFTMPEMCNVRLLNA